ncbi:unnamed protein product [Nesidiocoris tenuis]|uniref:Uncharacterized protein n=1 Tax=Nesidiocoris tenuis TaxID=355587 RepID=A0A6H5G1U4_9HEMI|nr:unnamed protein product [Nesidiocoris tenuis]
MEEEAAHRKEQEEARFKAQQDKDMELKKERLKALERRETEVDKILSQESLRSAILDDLHQREIVKGISRSLDAMQVSGSSDRLHKSTEYSASVTTMSARDTGVHTSRGISIVELLDYTPPSVPERTKKPHHSRRSEISRRPDAMTKWNENSSNFASESRRLGKDSPSLTLYESRDDLHTWDRSKAQSWANLNHPVPNYESPTGYRGLRRSMSPLNDLESYYDGTPYPQPQHRTRRSLSPLERSLIQPYTGSARSLASIGSRKHLDELTSARIRPPTPTRTYIPSIPRSKTKEHQNWKQICRERFACRSRVQLSACPASPGLWLIQLYRPVGRLPFTFKWPAVIYPKSPGSTKAYRFPGTRLEFTIWRMAAFSHFCSKVRRQLNRAFTPAAYLGEVEVQSTRLLQYRRVV